MRCFIPLAIIVTLFSCNLGTPLEVEIPEEKPKLVAQCFFAADCVWRLNVYSTLPALAPFQSYFEYDNNVAPYMVSDATAFVVSSSDNDTIPLTPKSYGHLGSVYISQDVPKSGETYTLVVSRDGYETVTSTSEVPHPVEIKSIQTRWEPYPEAPFATKYYFDINFQDPKGESNYYIISLHAKWDKTEVDSSFFWLGYQEWLSPTDASLADDFILDAFDWAPGTQMAFLYFNDQLFDGRDHTLNLYSILQYWNSSHEELKFLEFDFQLFSITEDYFTYVQTANKQIELAGDPFAQPVQVHGNIENGIGIFGGASHSFYTLKVK